MNSTNLLSVNGELSGQTSAFVE